MSQYQSSLGKRVYKLASYIRSYPIVLISIALISLFYLYKASVIPPYLAAITVFLLFNIIIVLRQSIVYFFTTASYLLIVFIYILLHFIPIGILEYVVDALLILTMLFTYAYYYYVRELKEVLQPCIPFIVLVSTITGIYLGVEHPLRYVLLTLIDSLASTTLLSISRSTVYRYTLSALFFTILYSSPIVNIKASALLTFALLHLTRNKFMFSSGREQLKYANVVLWLDLLVKPLVVVST
ncbi:MAG: hypothetical protein QW224_04515 [Desulfurococcaceae archaeon]